MLDKTEIKKGFLDTRKYILSHHEPHEYYRCYKIRILGKPVQLCARCTGIYPGIVLGVLAGYWTIFGDSALSVVALFPLFALIDWFATTFSERRGKNSIRTFTGSLLGCAYGLGLTLLIRGEIIVVAIGVCYAVVGGVLIWASKNE